jgi:hypothetical protein
MGEFRIGKAYVKSGFGRVGRAKYNEFDSKFRNSYQSKSCSLYAVSFVKDTLQSGTTYTDHRFSTGLAQVSKGLCQVHDGFVSKKTDHGSMS